MATSAALHGAAWWHRELLYWLLCLLVAAAVQFFMAKRTQRDAKKNPPPGAVGDIGVRNMHDGKNGTVLERKLTAHQRAKGATHACTLIRTEMKVVGRGNKRQTKAVYVVHCEHVKHSSGECVDLWCHPQYFKCRQLTDDQLSEEPVTLDSVIIGNHPAGSANDVDIEVPLAAPGSAENVMSHHTQEVPHTLLTCARPAACPAVHACTSCYTHTLLTCARPAACPAVHAPLPGL